MAEATTAALPALTNDTRIAVIGLGYVGLPLAVALAGHFDCIGFDISSRRINELRAGHDATGEISPERLRLSLLKITDDPEAMRGADIFIVTVPTPVDANNVPDLTPLNTACEILGPIIARGAVVVFESTVYPGLTEDECGPALERHSGLRSGRDFFLGYSPERINPGDKQNTIDKITKVVAGQTPAVRALLAQVYGRITTGGVFEAASIKVAEAAKVIENAQRDINIAFINEIATIFGRLGISVYDVLEAAKTKWNFLPFSPGLVGGHCIGVDPYYLAHLAEAKLGYHPRVILAGRDTNEGMGDYIAGAIAERLRKGAHVLVLGLTFKENVPDLRNTKVIDVVRGLQARGMQVDVHDYKADPQEAERHYGVALRRRMADLAIVQAHGEAERRTAVHKAQRYDCVVGAVAHQLFKELTAHQLSRLLKPDGLLADIKGMWRGLTMPEGVRRWEL
ncbi:MAG: nucleotide sugar dehydrogenase [Alphaproteobacteria bacterium]|nr:MAG: nucleotide sugar dehydrogenase [Alphaproteobacteria bacterium]